MAERANQGDEAKARSSFEADECEAFIAATRGRAPQPLSERAVAWSREAAAAAGTRALELGCGAGNEVLAMLEAGLGVLAIDRHQGALDATLAAATARGIAAGLELRRGPMEEVLKGIAGPFALVHARFALPFVPSRAFPLVWERIRALLGPRGVLCCQLFGPRDQFVAERPAGAMNFHDRSAVEGLVAGLEVLEWEEVAKDGYTALGRPKFWHVHHLLLRAPA
jgi:SAM-dependent methyltransferase